MQFIGFSTLIDVSCLLRMLKTSERLHNMIVARAAELGRRCVDLTSASGETERGIPPWALISWETDKKCITYQHFPPPVQRNIELETSAIDSSPTQSSLWIDNSVVFGVLFGTERRAPNPPQALSGNVGMTCQKRRINASFEGLLF